MNSFGIILGEPNSINSEILAKSNAYKSRAIVIGNFELLKSQLKILKINRKIKVVNKPEEIKKSKFLNILNVPLKFKNPFSVSPKESANYVKKCFAIAHNLCLQKRIKGIINCPINKKNVFKDKNIGVTEFLARKNKIYRTEVMVIYNKKLSVVPLTTHVKLKSLSKLIKKDLLLKKIKTFNSYYLRYFKKKPRIAVLGLNPHNYELKKNSEEVKIIIPVINKLK